MPRSDLPPFSRSLSALLTGLVVAACPRVRPTPHLPPQSARIEGRCCASEDGLALQGCLVVAEVSGATELADAAELARPKPVTTDDDGRFVLQVMARDGVDVQLIVMHSERAEERFWASSLRAGQTYQVDLPVDSGTPISGVVRSESGSPVRVEFDLVAWQGRSTSRGPRLSTHKAPPVFVPAPFVRQGPSDRLGRRHRVRSGQDGRYVVEQRLPHGDDLVQPCTPDFVCLYKIALDVPGDEEVNGDLIVRQGAYLAGHVVDHQGRPVEGVVLRIAGGGPLLDATAVSRQDGSFELANRVHGARPARIILDCCADCEPIRATPAYEWGKHDILVELHRSPDVEVRAVMADTGEPLERFAVRSWAVGDDRRASRLRLPGGHRDGRVRVTVRRSPSWIAVVPTDPRLMPEQVAVVGGEDMQPIEVRVRRLVPMPVVLVDAQGAPIAGAVVSLLLPGNYESNALPEFTDLRGEVLDCVPRKEGQIPKRRLSRTTSDADGRCLVFGLEQREDMELLVAVARSQLRRVTGVLCRPEVQQIVVR